MTAPTTSPASPVPAPRSRSLLTPVVAIAVVAVAILLILVLVLPTLTTPPGPPPTVTLSAVYAAGVATVTADQVSKALAPSYYRVNITLSGQNGTSVAMPAQDNGTVAVAVSSRTFSVTWEDRDKSGTLTVGDAFAVTQTSGPPSFIGAVYTFWLLASDNRGIASASWSHVQKPVVTFSSPAVTGSNCTFIVAGASSALVFANYKANLLANGTAGTALALTSSPSVMDFTIGGHTYVVTLTDISGSGQLMSGDAFRITGLVPTTSYQFVLIWAADGSAITTVAWNT